MVLARIVFPLTCGVIPKPGVFASGARDLACSANCSTQDPSLRLNNGFAQDDASKQKLKLSHYPLDGAVRSPKMAVPIRTQVDPSSIATSKSCDMPMESVSMEIAGNFLAAI
jgi:hypothetical protein